MRLVIHLAIGLFMGYLAVFYGNLPLSAITAAWLAAIPAGYLLCLRLRRMISVRMTASSAATLTETAGPLGGEPSETPREEQSAEDGTPASSVKTVSADVPVEFRLDNASVLPQFADIRCRWEGMYDKHPYTDRFEEKLGSTATEIRKRLFGVSAVGFYTAKLEKMTVSDPLRLFSMRVKQAENREIGFNIWPQTEPVYVLWPADGYHPGMRGDVTGKIGGEDTDEVFQLRSYRPGDRVNSVHWKLTARENELIVREFSREEEPLLYLALEPRRVQEGTTEQDGQAVGKYLSRMISVARGLIREGYPFYLGWQEAPEGSWELHDIRSEESLYQALGAFYRVPLFHAHIVRTPEEMLPGGHWLRLDSKLEFTLDGRKVAVAGNPEGGKSHGS